VPEGAVVLLLDPSAGGNGQALVRVSKKKRSNNSVRDKEGLVPSTHVGPPGSAGCGASSVRVEVAHTYREAEAGDEVDEMDYDEEEDEDKNDDDELQKKRMVLVGTQTKLLCSGCDFTLPVHSCIRCKRMGHTTLMHGHCNFKWCGNTWWECECMFVKSVKHLYCSLCFGEQTCAHCSKRGCSCCFSQCCAEGCEAVFCAVQSFDEWKPDGRGHAPGCGMIKWPDHESEDDAECFFENGEDHAWVQTHRYCKGCAPAGSVSDYDYPG
jgi:hypothetical protein